MGIFSILKIESLFPSLSIYFFAHPQIQISVCLGEKWGWNPPDMNNLHLVSLAFANIAFFGCTASISDSRW